MTGEGEYPGTDAPNGQTPIGHPSTDALRQQARRFVQDPERRGFLRGGSAVATGVTAMMPRPSLLRPLRTSCSPRPCRPRTTPYSLTWRSTTYRRSPCHISESPTTPRSPQAPLGNRQEKDRFLSGSHGLADALDLFLDVGVLTWFCRRDVCRKRGCLSAAQLQNQGGTKPFPLCGHQWWAAGSYCDFYLLSAHKVRKVFNASFVLLKTQHQNLFEVLV